MRFTRVLSFRRRLMRRDDSSEEEPTPSVAGHHQSKDAWHSRPASRKVTVGACVSHQPPPQPRISVSRSAGELRNHHHHCAQTSANDVPYLPIHLVCRVLDAAPLTVQLRARAVCRRVRAHVDEQLSEITTLHVEKRPFLADNECWQSQPDTQVAVARNGATMRIRVQPAWTARDVAAVVGLLGAVRRTVRTATFDAPILELLVASVSSVDLKRWYAVQCLFKALRFAPDAVSVAAVAADSTDDSDDEEIVSSAGRRSSAALFFPALSSLTVRSTPEQTAHLARLLDYGVRSSAILSRRRLSKLSVELEVAGGKMTEPDRTNRLLYYFRCWVGSAGFDERFQQHSVDEKSLHNPHHHDREGKVEEEEDKENYGFRRGRKVCA